MIRASVIVLAMLAAVAAAEPKPPQIQVSPNLYFNRCVGGCTIHGAASDDAAANTSSLPCMSPVCAGGACYCPNGGDGEWMVHEFTNDAGEIGSAADDEWNQIMQCLREVYSPFAVTVSDTPPPGGQSYNEGIVAGTPDDIGFGSAGVGGIAPATTCVARDNVMSFSFANIYHGSDRILTICGVAAQETAHAYGLDHQYEYADHSSACNDPMSYRPNCGQRFFRNAAATCGEYSPRVCVCGGTQNSHLKILGAFGPGTPITTPPHATVVAPPANSQVSNGATVQVMAGAQRGIAKVELWLNGYKWTEVDSSPMGSQPDSAYALTFPPDVPDGIIDIVAKAYDDLPIEGDAPTITVTKGAPCVDATSCAAGQKCDQGRCYWDPPAGALGDPCTYPQYCTTGQCTDTSGGMLCTEDCIPSASDSCPAMFTCQDEGNGNGACLPASKSGGGCCSASDGEPPWLQGALAACVLAIVMRRRRFSASRAS